MDLNLAGKVVVVTGGTAGIGLAAVREFALEGCKVVTCGRSSEKFVPAKKALADAGSEVHFYQLDITDLKSQKTFAEDVFSKFGSIDVWVNNAGVVLLKRTLEHTEEDWDRIMNTNLKALFFACQNAARCMIKSGKGGVIINLSSFSAQVSRTGLVAYAASKAAVISVTKTFAADLAPHGIRVASVSPGPTATEMTKGRFDANNAVMTQNIAMQRLGETAEIARPLVVLASDVCSYVTGVDIQINGGKLAVQHPEEVWR